MDENDEECVICVHTVSQVRHLVSLVNTPSKSLCTKVASAGGVPELERVVIVGGVFEDAVVTEPVTERKPELSH